MAMLIIESSDLENIKLLTELAKKLGDRVKSVNASEIEDLLLGHLMDMAKTGEYVDKSEVLQALQH